MRFVDYLTTIRHRYLSRRLAARNEAEDWVGVPKVIRSKHQKCIKKLETKDQNDFGGAFHVCFSLFLFFFFF